MTFSNGLPADDGSRTTLPSDSLEYTINHVFLPPRLPQEDDTSPINDSALTNEVLEALKAYNAMQNQPSNTTPLAKSVAMIKNMVHSRAPDGRLLDGLVQTQMGSMKENDVLAFHVKAQNAALYIRRQKHHYTFETFEVSCPNANVTGTQGRLERSLPAEAMSISTAQMGDPAFREPFVEMLVKMDALTPRDAYRVSRKANKQLAEIRDAVDPRYFTEMVFAILRGMGEAADIPRIQKHIRDEVLWSEAFAPWRRSPLWIVLRVAIQTTFMRCSDPEIGRAMFKAFMMFLMSRILGRAVKANMLSDTIHCMERKIIRRLQKICLLQNLPWVSYIDRTLREATTKLKQRWCIEIEKKKEPFQTQTKWNPSILSFQDDTVLRIASLHNYFCAIGSRIAAPTSHAVIEVGCYERIPQNPSVLPNSQLLTTKSGEARRILLADVETWTHTLLPAWHIANIDHSSACSDVANLIKEYTSAGLAAYGEDQESISLMFLTAMELWVCLDKMVTRHEPILLDYNTEFPPALFDPLLLPRRHQMDRLLAIEQHISSRRSRSKNGYPSMFRSFSARNSIAVRYFDQSLKHQKLRTDIERDATAVREEKRQELVRKEKEQAGLEAKAAAVSHTEVPQWKWNKRTKKSEERKVHSPSCQKCAWKNQASRLRIDIHEWPLPSEDLQTRAVVFELNCPKSISVWRDSTYYILVDVFTAVSAKPRNAQRTGKYHLRTYGGLRPYCASQSSRIELASAAKPFAASHYREMNVSNATQSNICVEHALRYDVYDSHTEILAREFMDHYGIRGKCSQKLPQGPYQCLQYSVNDTKHFPNQIIADQSTCPPEISIHEFLAFGHVRAGHRLQWQNIALSLVDGNLNLNQESTRTLIAQAVWEAGPSMPNGDSVLRDSHAVLGNPSFCVDILQSLASALAGTKENWQAATSVRTFITLALRILSLSPHRDVRMKSLDFLTVARRVTLSWTRKLMEELRSGVEDDQSDSWSNTALEVALSCYGTFAVDPCDMPQLLTSGNNVAMLTECAITIHDLCPASTTSLPDQIQRSLFRFSRTTHAMEETLHEILSQDANGLDDSIKRLWTSYCPGTPWRSVKGNRHEWLMTESAGNDVTASVLVHYNLLTGSLLVNGSPLSRLPRHYEVHGSYQRLFGTNAINVVPSAMAGMRFESRVDVHGYQIYFAMDGSNLIIRATKEGRCFEILPIESLRGDFPPVFIEKYSHWLDLATNTVEFRPLDDPWMSQALNWTIHNLGARQRTLTKGTMHHIDMHSRTARAVSKVLSPIEDSNHIHISFKPMTESLDVQLIRLKLGFFLNRSHDLECKQRRNMIVDTNQSCGAFTGLCNKLLLQSIKDSSRSIIIPHGAVEPEIKGHHVEVHINTGTAGDVAYHYYELDALLRRFTDNGSLRSGLYRTLLHAMTSHCLPDQFTGRTGTEQAIHNLKEASTHSFRVLDREEIQILETIARLTPRRVYYPRSLQVMQQIAWHHGLPSLSQHESFSSLVCEIFERARQHQIFYQSDDMPDQAEFGEPTLLKKAIVRISGFRGPGFGAEDYTNEHDDTYSGEAKLQEQSICGLSKLTNEWSQNLKVTSSLLADIEGWGKPIKGKAHYDFDSLSYDKSWFDATEQVPHYAEYNLVDGYEPKKHELLNVIQRNAKDFWSCPESSLPRLADESSWEQANARRQHLHEEAQLKHANDLAEQLISQWPSATIQIPARNDFASYFSLGPISTNVGTKFSSCFQNKAFKEFIGRAQIVMNGLRPSSRLVGFYSVPKPAISIRVVSPKIDWDMLFGRQPPKVYPIDDLSLNRFLQKSLTTSDCGKTRRLLDRMLSQCTGKYEVRYSQDMLHSLKCLQEAEQESHLIPKMESYLRIALRDAADRSEAHVSSIFDAICASFINQASLADRLAYDASAWPRLSPTALLQHLSCSNTISSEWKNVLLQYGISLSKLQYYRRLLSIPGNGSEFLKELMNSGHVGWDPEQYPEWLLFEIENNLLIRPAQAQIAKEMLQPSCGGNCIMQLNMGEGKSSVIVPIVVATLSKGQQLPRVIVLPALAAQMFHILRQKLGGILNHRVVAMPFSRSVQLSADQADTIQRLYQRLLQEKCVVLCQPEHVLSFDLMGIEKSLGDRQAQLGTTLVDTQRWIDRHTRDILDESDEILNVKFELIYTIGLQTAIDFSPYRWAIVTNILGILEHCLHSIDRLQQMFPDGLQVHWTATGGFPHLQILQSQAGEKLLHQVVEELLTNGGLPDFPVWTYHPEDRKALLEYIINPHQPEPHGTPGLSSLFDSKQKRMILLLLKGLFAHGILLFAFQHKRWRVNYGHDFSRSMLAVPYRAKDLPALRAEFSHPDVTILLTCLSYYYEGLSNEQLFLCFNQLLASDNPEGEYDLWVSKVEDLPKAFCNLSGINLRDRPQCIYELFPLIRRSKVVIDFYMLHLVFPKELKEFPDKLSSSGWDIARAKHHPMTGFSGTNDSRYLLPLTVKQADIPDQIHTNATVLDCLLQPRNTFQIIPNTGNTASFLDVVVSAKPEVRVILDVGALILEWRNDEMARNWLERVSSTEVEAVVFFDEQDELVVLTRDGRCQSLQESPMLKQMDKCLLYLDEAHTRGTDVKLPPNYRAAATLGIGLTKDRLVQACMRMRKLAHGQSVMLCAPPEIYRMIVERAGKPNDLPVEVEDVLLWSMANTHDYTRKCVPPWAIQGMRHQKRNIAWNGAGRSELVLEPEAKSLQDRYRVRDRKDSTKWLLSFGADVLSSRLGEVSAIQEKLADFGATSIDGAALHEEQERELSPESELERQLERPPKMAPAQHSLHNDLLRMVNQGWLDPSSPAFVPAFQTLENTSAANDFNLASWPSGLLTTEDFARTVQAASSEKQNDFIRPVQWILSCPKLKVIAIISPFEANELHLRIRGQEKIALHVYSPRTRGSMPPLDGLEYSAIPSRGALAQLPGFSLQIQLNLFAGQLYFRHREEYVSVCRFLGLASRPGDAMNISADGFVDPNDRKTFDSEMARVCSMAESPVDILRTLVKFRRKGQGFGKTHLGLLLGGELIKDHQFAD
ncbi:hypothetical protein GQ44DRAFT_632794 [Phaeosphaeriaceae sp. PMI808]|nr:hypothetical protein GQ44DRAFT_632794 [Phaeosphaeriaceae sp. PMI808]